MLWCHQRWQPTYQKSMAVASRRTGKYDTGEPVFLDPMDSIAEPIGLLFYMDYSYSTSANAPSKVIWDQKCDSNG
jgi:hypothetical protein